MYSRGVINVSDEWKENVMIINEKAYCVLYRACKDCRHNNFCMWIIRDRHIGAYYRARKVLRSNMTPREKAEIIASLEAL